MGALSTITGDSLYLDTNVLIYTVEDAAGLGARLRPTLERIDAGALRGVSSELSLAETLVKPFRNNALGVCEQYVDMLAADGPLTVVPVSREVLTRAAELRAKYPSLKLPDAIHAATAILHNCTTFLTNDARFETIAELAVMLVSRL